MAEVGITYSAGVPSTIGVLELDVLLTEDTSLSAKATRYAVENGSPITDHVVLDSEGLRLSGWITPNNVYQMTAEGRPKMLDAKETLRKMLADRQTITVTTGLDTYTDMVIEKCDIGRNNEGDRINVDMELVKIRKAELRRADIPPDKVASGTKGKAGATKTKAGKANPDNEPSTPAKSKLAARWDSLK